MTALYIAQLTPSGTLTGPPRMTEVKGSRHVTALAFRKSVGGSYLCSTHTGLAYLSEATGELEHLAGGLGQIISEDEKDNFRFNDGVCDSKGRFYFHSMSRNEEAKSGKLYMYEKGMKSVADLKVLEDGFAIGNGPVVDEQRNKLYFNFTDSGVGCEHLSDTLRLSQADSLLDVYDYDPSTGAISNRSEFFDNFKRRPSSLFDPLTSMLGPGLPDGHTLDTAGNVYQCVFSRGSIERFTPDGIHDLTINLPARCPTCPVFGGQDLTTLYVTSASQALMPGEQQLLGDEGGCVLSIDLSQLMAGAKGIVKPDFNG